MEAKLPCLSREERAAWGNVYFLGIAGSGMAGGDGTHDGDVGGGQLLNACVWYEVLTGKDCRENPYAPVYQWEGNTYTLNETMVRMLKEAAHRAVTEILPAYPEN